MNQLYQSAFLKALGWSLIDSFWQTGAMWLLYILLTRNGKSLRSSQRYTLGVMALSSGCLWFLITLASNYYHLAHSRPVQGFAPFFANGWIEANLIDQVAPFISVAYLFFMLFSASRWVIQFSGTRMIPEKNCLPADIYLSDFIEGLRYISGITRPVRIWISDKLTTPVTVGFLKPLIFLPVSVFSQLNTRQIEALITHEFFHIRRNDYLLNILMSFAELILFFNPFAGIIHSIIRKERENCCDDEVLRLGYSRLDYAQALYILGKNNIPAYQFALAATGSGKYLLLERVKRIMNRPQTNVSVWKPATAFFLCLFIAITFNRYENSVDYAMKPAPVYNNNPSGKSIIILEKRFAINGHPLPVQTAKVTTKKITTRNVTVTTTTFAPPPSEPEAPVPFIEDEESFFRFVSDDKVQPREYSLIQSQPAPKPSLLNADPGLPYVPESTFYYPSYADSTADKKIVVF